MSTADRLRRAGEILAGEALADSVDLVAWPEDGAGSNGAVLVRNHRGTARLIPNESLQLLDGESPIPSTDPLAFLPYALEVEDPSPPNERNAYPDATRRLCSVFADPIRSPDLWSCPRPGCTWPIGVGTWASMGRWT